MKITGPRGKSAQAVGFWGRSGPKPGIVSVRRSSSKLARTLAFLRRIVGWGPKNG